MATTTIIPLHVGKGRTVAAALGMSVDYIENPDKTEGGEWVTSYECDPLIADSEFAFAKRRYATITGRSQGDKDVIAYHIRISFKPGEIDALTASKIGYDLAMKLTHGNHAFVCCTHTDKAHTHCHIVVNSTSLDCTKKFRNFKGSTFAVRRIADKLCVENGLSIIDKPKRSRGGYSMRDDRPTSRQKLKKLIDNAAQNATDFDGFIAALSSAGCEVKRGRYLAFKLPDGERFIRCKSLGDGYTEDAILQALSSPKHAAAVSEARPNLLIDIQAKLREGKGGGCATLKRV